MVCKYVNAPTVILCVYCYHYLFAIMIDPKRSSRKFDFAKASLSIILAAVKQYGVDLAQFLRSNSTGYMTERTNVKIKEVKCENVSIFDNIKCRYVGMCN